MISRNEIPDPLRSRALAPWPVFDDEQIAAVERVLRSGRVNSWTGDETTLFEQEYAGSLGLSYALAMSNGTVSLELAVKALDLGPGDEVIVTPRSFIASVSCVVACGATPVFADVDRQSGNITPESIGSVLTSRTRAVVVVHLAGWPCDMEGIVALARSRNLKIVEDCAQAHGASLSGKPVGTFGDVAAFSFCQDKILTTGGEGGLLVTRDKALWQKLWTLREHGKSYDACFHRDWPPGFRWTHESFGTNARMTEMQAAIGRVALRRLAAWVERRGENAAVLDAAFAEIPGVRTAVPPAGVQHARYKYYVYLRPEHLRSGWYRDRITAELAARGVPCDSGTCPEIYREKAFTGTAAAGLHLPVAHELGTTSLMFLVHPTIERGEMQWMADTAAEVLRQASAL